MGYKPPWEWPRAMGAVATLIAGGWLRVVLPPKWVNAMGRVTTWLNRFFGVRVPVDQ